LNLHARPTSSNMHCSATRWTINIDNTHSLCVLFVLWPSVRLISVFDCLTLLISFSGNCNFVHDRSSHQSLCACFFSSLQCEPLMYSPSPGRIQSFLCTIWSSMVVSLWLLLLALMFNRYWYNSPRLFLSSPAYIQNTSYIIPGCLWISSWVPYYWTTYKEWRRCLFFFKYTTTSRPASFEVPRGS
jgi:hypothetical protein